MNYPPFIKRNDWVLLSHSERMSYLADRDKAIQLEMVRSAKEMDNLIALVAKRICD